MEDCHCRIRDKQYEGSIGGQGLGTMGLPAEQQSIRAERGERYGHVQINHASIGAIWGAILLQAMSSGRWDIGSAIPPELVTLMMVGVKMSREAFRHGDDNIVDAKNYIDFTDELSRS